MTGRFYHHLFTIYFVYIYRGYYYYHELECAAMAGFFFVFVLCFFVIVISVDGVAVDFQMS